ncbi:MAG TPA: cytochrome c3 family protein [Candidatus Methylacidiphilales bacterium]|nr:cytochrome c3 family protein [Candidatus Methylacidiphilales bacterium]
MAQLFSSSFDFAARAVAAGILLLITGGVYAAYLLNRSPYWTNVGVELPQPVPFSHQHHVAELGIDCRFCHRTVTKAAYAGMPDTLTCMTCHSQVWKDAPMLAPVRQSYAKNTPLHWNKVNEVPEFVYFNHSIHVAKGVGCSSCHGRVDEMPITYKPVDFEMQWCLRCHRHPEESLRPQLSQVFQMDWKPTATPAEAQAIATARHIDAEHLSDCSACHR